MRRVVPLSWRKLLAAVAMLLCNGALPAVGPAAAATSPVLLGDQNIESTVDANSSGRAEAFPFTNSNAGSAGSVTVYVDSRDTATKLSVGLYNTSSGHPGALLGSGSLSNPTKGGWNAVSINSSNLGAGATYWVAVLGTGGTLNFRDRTNSGCYSYTSSQSSLTSMPSNWSDGSRWASCSLSAYVSGALAGPPPAPGNLTAPAVSGQTAQGNMLSTSNGSWSDSPTSYAYKWQDCDSSGANCASISGATSSGYMLTSSDVGHTIRSVVTASNGGGSSTPSSSAQTAMVSPPPPAAPSDTAAPVVSGEAVQGQTLTTSTGSWSNSPTSYAYKWQDCDGSGANCASIPGATSSGYTLAAGDVGHTIRSVVTGSNAGGSSSPASSAQTAVVTAPAPPPVPQNTTAPVVSGQAVQGQQLTTSNGSWSNGPTSYAYKWQDCDASGASCSNISGATSSSYVLGSGDVGHTIRSVVTASNAGGSASPASSSPTTVVTASSGGGGGSTSCTTTVSSLSSVVSLSSSEPNGAVICIAPGSYGQLTLSATRSGYVTIAAASGPGTVKLSGLQIDSSGDFLHLDGLTVSDNTELGSSPNGGSAPSNIQITNTDSEGFQVEAGAVNLLFDHDYSHDGPYGFLLNGSRYPVQGGCCQTANYPYIQNVTIENSEISNPQADAFQVKGFENVTIANNDIWDVNQNGNHNDGVQTVHGGSNLTITHNYFHDGNVELFMIKDGLINGLNITDNLSVRQSSANNPSCGGCSTAVMGQVYAPTNAVIENNTFLQPAFLLRSQVGLVGNGNPDYPEPSNVTVSHNVITQFRAQDDDQNGSIGAFATAMSESNDIFGTWSKNYLTAPFPGPGTTFNNNPQFMCGTSCGNGTPAGDDYRLASNPNDIGIDWTPNQQSYGPMG